MNPLLKKEIRLVLPAWLAVLLLELCLPWLGKDQDQTLSVAPLFFFFGIILLAVDSFGREFSLGTFTSLMAQPVDRRQIWRTKIAVLVAAAALVFAGYFISCDLRLQQALSDSNSIWHVNPMLISATFNNAMTASLAVLLVALTGGLWTALLLRQVSAAFWITFLAPAGLLVIIALVQTFLFKTASDEAVDAVIYGAAGLYVVFAFWLARRLMLRAEDAGWTGGAISFSQWRYFEGAKSAGVSRRHWRPFTALLKKELQLHSISLFGAGTLLGLHVLVIFLRGIYTNFHRNTLAAMGTDLFWCLWLVIPLVMGCTAVAEERKMGVADSQFGLSVSRRRQFTVKLLLTMVFGVLLGGAMPLLLENLAAKVGEPGSFFGQMSLIATTNFPGFNWFPIGVVALAAALAGAGFFASTLAKNFLQALSIAILLIVGLAFLGSFITWLGESHATLLGLMPIPWLLLILLSPFVLLGLFLWLGYRNFSFHHESSRLWRRNVSGFLGTLLLLLAGSAVVYERVWEFFMPVEPPHGMARFSPANPPILAGEAGYSSLQVRLPGGRVWCDSLGGFYWQYQYEPWKQLWHAMINRTPVSDGPRAFIAGSNWVSTAFARVHFWKFWESSGSSISTQVAGYLDTAGIQSDGTLWISSEARPLVWNGASMTRFGDEANWRQVSSHNRGLILLKTDGTLWQWGGGQKDWNQWRTNWPSVRTSRPRQIGTDSDWQELWRGYPRKKDGSLWQVDFEGATDKVKLSREMGIAAAATHFDDEAAFVGPDGALWLNRHYNEYGNGWQGTGFLQAGRETNWRTVVASMNRLMALKTDGTLWQWDISSAQSAEEAVKNPPTRLGIHNDWVALIYVTDEAVALAADGSLWLWPDQQPDEPTLLRLPRQPKLLGNVFAAN